MTCSPLCNVRTTRWFDRANQKLKLSRLSSIIATPEDHKVHESLAAQWRLWVRPVWVISPTFRDKQDKQLVLYIWQVCLLIQPKGSNLQRHNDVELPTLAVQQPPSASSIHVTIFLIWENQEFHCHMHYVPDLVCEVLIVLYQPHCQPQGCINASKVLSRLLYQYNKLIREKRSTRELSRLVVLVYWTGLCTFTSH